MRKKIEFLSCVIAFLAIISLNDLKSQSLSDSENHELSTVLLNNELFSEIITNQIKKKSFNENNISVFNDKTILTVDLKNTLKKNMTYHIFSSTGQNLFSGLLNTELYTIKIDDLSPGIYYLSILENNNLIKSHTFSVI